MSTVLFGILNCGLKTSCRAWWVSSYTKPEGFQQQHRILAPSNSTSRFNFTSSYNETTSAFLHVLLTHPTVRNLSADILSGQIIASVIVLGFVAVFLLREWISQNARPGVFDDAEAPPEGDVPPAADPANPAAVVAQAHPPPPAQPAAPLPLLLDGPARPAPVRLPNGAEADTRRGERRKIRRVEADGIPQRTKKGKEPANPSPKVVTTPAKRRHSWDGPSSSRSSPVASSSGLGLNPEQTRFTFTAQIPPYRSSTEQPLHHDLPERESSPGSSPSSSSTSSRRPPLPMSTLPSSPSSSGSTVRSSTHTPLASPSLATYRAPEEFEAGPSDLSSDFENGKSDTSQPDSSADSDDTLIEDLPDEHHHYFREPIQETNHSTSEDSGSYHASPERSQYEDGAVDLPELMPLSDDEPFAIEPTAPGDLPGRDQGAHANPGQVAPWADQEDDVEEEEDDEDAIMPFGGVDDDELPLLAPRPAPPAPLRQEEQQPARPEQDALDQEEIDAAMEDDMDGALEGKLVMINPFIADRLTFNQLLD